jgi:hypothetical protein
MQGISSENAELCKHFNQFGADILLKLLNIKDQGTSLESSNVFISPLSLAEPVSYSTER